MLGLCMRIRYVFPNLLAKQCFTVNSPGKCILVRPDAMFKQKRLPKTYNLRARIKNDKERPTKKSSTFQYLFLKEFEGTQPMT